MPRVGLSMIVKNESKLIRRCLESVRPLIDFAVICDTGSTDNTIEIIHQFIDGGLPGAVYINTWKNFSANRNQCLNYLNEKHRNMSIDYVFVIDADDILEIAPDFDRAAFVASMDKDVYDIEVQHGSVVHSRPQLFRNTKDYFYVGVLHEFLEVATKPFTRAPVPGLRIKASIEGSRNNDPMKFFKDAQVLERALKTEQHEYLRGRYTFYLAQSYRDYNDPSAALLGYIKRSEMGMWDQEVYVSLVEAIRCCSKLMSHERLDVAKDCFKRALEYDYLGRIEAHHAMAFLYRQLGMNKEGMEAARPGLDKPIPEGLFVEPWIYNYGLRDEFAVNAYWANCFNASFVANLRLLSDKRLPADNIARIAENALASYEKVKQHIYYISD